MSITSEPFTNERADHCDVPIAPPHPSFNPESCRNETEVESKLIVQELLPALGYTPDVWYQEIAFGSIRLDFLVFARQIIPLTLATLSQFPLSLVVEAKGPKENLERHERKLKHYLLKLHAHFGVLTNGKEFRIYQRVEDNVKQVFNCRGYEICERLPDIKKIIGREEIRQAISGHPPESKVESQPTANLELNRGITTMKVITVYHNKGGVGKTTVVVNLAAALRKKGKRVLVIDLDSQANTTFAVGLMKFLDENDDTLKKNNACHFLLEQNKFFIPDVARRSQFNNPELDVIPSHIDLMKAESNFVAIESSKFRITKKLEKEQKEKGSDPYDIVIIDTPPSLNFYARVALINTNYLIIPSDLKPFANEGLNNVSEFIQDINSFRDSINKPPIHILGVLPCKISTNNKFVQHTLPSRKSVIMNRYGFPLMNSCIFEREELAKCLENTITVGDLDIPDPKSVMDYKPNSQAAQEFDDLANEVLMKIGEKS